VREHLRTRAVANTGVRLNITPSASVPSALLVPASDGQPLASVPSAPAANTSARGGTPQADQASLPSLVKQLRNRNEIAPRRIAAAEALGEIKSVDAAEKAEAEKVLVEILRDRGEEPSVREAAAKDYLCIIGIPQATPENVGRLAELLYSEDESVKRALVKIGAPAVEPLIAAASSDPWWPVRRCAVEILGSIGDQRAIEALLERLRADKYHYVRRAAARALARLGPEEAIAPLVEALKDFWVRKAVVQALHRLVKKGSPSVGLLIALLKDNDPDVRHAAVKVLGSIEDEKAITPLIGMLSDDYPKVRISAARALGKFEAAQGAVTILRDLLGKAQPKNIQRVYTRHSAVVNVEIGGPSIEYEALRDALLKIEGSVSPAVPLERVLKPTLFYNVPDGLNVALTEEAYCQGRIKLEDIEKSNSEVAAFLRFLRENNLRDIVVIGGAVRDILFGLPADDIDISVAVELTAEEKFDLNRTAAPATRRVVACAIGELGKLAGAIGVPVENFIVGSDAKKPVFFSGKDVQYAGPIEVTAQDNTPVNIKRVLFDKKSRGVFSSQTGVGLLSLAVDCDGYVYGAMGALADVLEGKAGLVGDAENFFLGDIVRLLRLKHQFELAISDADYKLIRDTIAKYKTGELSLALPDSTGAQRQIIISAIHRQIEKVLSNAKDRAAAMRELDELGILSLVGAPLTPPSPPRGEGDGTANLPSPHRGEGEGEGVRNDDKGARDEALVSLLGLGSLGSAIAIFGMPFIKEYLLAHPLLSTAVLALICVGLLAMAPPGPRPSPPPSPQRGEGVVKPSTHPDVVIISTAKPTVTERVLKGMGYNIAGTATPFSTGGSSGKLASELEPLGINVHPLGNIAAPIVACADGYKQRVLNHRFGDSFRDMAGKKFVDELKGIMREAREALPGLADDKFDREILTIAEIIDKEFVNRNPQVINLSEHSVENLILLGLMMKHNVYVPHILSVYRNKFNRAIREFTALLGLREGEANFVYPTFERAKLKATTLDGAIDIGEWRIATRPRNNLSDKIVKLEFTSKRPLRANPVAKKLIENARHAIVVGPGRVGRFFTKILPTLMIPEIAEALAKRKDIPRILVLGPLTAEEMRHQTVTDVISAVEVATGKKFEELFDYVIVHDPAQTSEQLPQLRNPERLFNITEEESESLEGRGVKVIMANLVSAGERSLVYDERILRHAFNAIAFMPKWLPPKAAREFSKQFINLSESIGPDELNKFREYNLGDKYYEGYYEHLVGEYKEPEAARMLAERIIYDVKDIMLFEQVRDRLRENRITCPRIVYWHPRLGYRTRSLNAVFPDSHIAAVEREGRGETARMKVMAAASGIPDERLKFYATKQGTTMDEVKDAAGRPVFPVGSIGLLFYPYPQRLVGTLDDLGKIREHTEALIRSLSEGGLMVMVMDKEAFESDKTYKGLVGRAGMRRSSRSTIDLDSQLKFFVPCEQAILYADKKALKRFVAEIERAEGRIGGVVKAVHKQLETPGEVSRIVKEDPKLYPAIMRYRQLQRILRSEPTPPQELCPPEELSLPTIAVLPDIHGHIERFIDADEAGILKRSQAGPVVLKSGRKVDKIVLLGDWIGDKETVEVVTGCSVEEMMRWKKPSDVPPASKNSPFVAGIGGHEVNAIMAGMKGREAEQARRFLLELPVNFSRMRWDGFPEDKKEREKFLERLSWWLRINAEPFYLDQVYG